MNLKMAKPAAEFSLKAPPRIDVICNSPELSSDPDLCFLDKAHLCIEASVREAEEEASKDRQVLVGCDVRGVRDFRLSKGSFEGEIEKHKKVANHADDKTQDDDWGKYP